MGVTILTDENGVQREYREVKRKARVGERIKSLKNDHMKGFNVGDIFEVTRRDKMCHLTGTVFTDKNGAERAFWLPEEYVVLEPTGIVIVDGVRYRPVNETDMKVCNVTINVTVNGTIEDVVRAVESELKAKMFESFYLASRDPEKYALKPKPLTREQIIEKAKRDVAEMEQAYMDANVESVYFVVNREKRTVVALLKYCGTVMSRGIAKCAPDDCFNVHIGKAIALRRALGLEVPAEYLNAPQPTEVRVGDIVEFEKEGRIATVVADWVRQMDIPRETFLSTAVEYGGKVIDDSREEVSA